MKHAGVAQHPEPRAPRPEDAGANPAPRSNLAGPLVAGLQIDETDREAGYQDGLAGRKWEPLARDWLSYSCGHAAGERDRLNGLGARP